MTSRAQDSAAVIDARMDRAHLSLAALTVGDTVGERFFAHPDVVEGLPRSPLDPPEQRSGFRW